MANLTVNTTKSFSKLFQLMLYANNISGNQLISVNLLGQKLPIDCSDIDPRGGKMFCFFGSKLKNALGTFGSDF